MALPRGGRLLEDGHQALRNAGRPPPPPEDWRRKAGHKQCTGQLEKWQAGEQLTRLQASAPLDGLQPPSGLAVEEHRGVGIHSTQGQSS